MVTICKECQFAKKIGMAQEVTGRCLSVDAPVTDYVSGFKACRLINNGKCKFFKELVKPLEEH